jgi:hypothetical protein
MATDNFFSMISASQISSTTIFPSVRAALRRALARISA